MKFVEFFAVFAVMVAELNAMIPNGVKVGYQDMFGQVENPGTFPYIVHLDIKIWNDTINAYQMSGCGGSIIRRNVVLTAAHCVKGARPENVEATAGIVHIGIFQESQQSIVGRRIVYHEEFDFPRNDIALVFLVKEFQNSIYVNTIALSRASQYQDHMDVTAIGWGFLIGDRKTEWLHRGDFVIVSNEVCYSHIPLYFSEGLLCVLDEKELQKTGKGDSGGPLVRNNFLVGSTVGSILDFRGIYNARLPSLFTNISYYTNWISQQIGYDLLFHEK